ncbi:MAG: dihydrofolate reductase, partial [Pseudomonadota bacterium]
MAQDRGSSDDATGTTHPDPLITIVVAVANNGVIGRDGDLPWRVPSDLKTFRKLTLGKPVVMGRRTFQSIGKPLDGRKNIVVTRQTDFKAAGAVTAGTVEAALSIAKDAARETDADEIAIIGGGQIYAAALDQVDRVYLTRIAAEPDGDAEFPDLDPDTWVLIETRPIAPDPRDEHAAELCVYSCQ